MKTSTLVWVVIIVLIIVGGGWYLYARGSATTMYPSQTTTQNPATSTPATSASVLSTGSSATLGSYLTAANGMTLYKYTPDAPSVSNCSGQCAVVWPPYTVAAGTPLAAASGISGTLATITRSDGTTQLTYKGMPLYFYADDTKPGDTNGQNVGGIWFVVTP